MYAHLTREELYRRLRAEPDNVELLREAARRFIAHMEDNGRNSRRGDS